MISKSQEEFMWGALVGGLVGAVAALALTPLSGASLRKQVAKKMNHLNGHFSNHSKLSKNHVHTQAAPKKTSIAPKRLSKGISKVKRSPPHPKSSHS